MATIPLDQKRIDRFWAKVDKTGPCWKWQGRKKQYGYGRYHLDGKDYLAHRVSYQILAGPLDDSMVIDHKCHNASCVNPAHLQQVPRTYNSQNRAGAMKNSKTGVRGVTWDEARGYFRAQVTSFGIVYRKAGFKTLAEAEAYAVELRLQVQPNSLADRALTTRA